jgi:hypothetical protein
MATIYWKGGTNQSPTTQANWVTASGGDTEISNTTFNGGNLSAHDVVLEYRGNNDLVISGATTFNSITINYHAHADYSGILTVLQNQTLTLNRLTVKKANSIGSDASPAIIKFVGSPATDKSYISFDTSVATGDITLNTTAGMVSESRRDLFTFDFAPATDTSITMHDGKYPHIKVTTGSNAVFFSPTYVEDLDNTYGSVDMLGFDSDAPIQPLTRTQNDSTKMFSINGTLTMDADTSADATISSHRNDIAFDWGLSTLKITPNSTAYYIPVNGDVGFGTSASGVGTFNTKYNNLIIGKSTTATHRCVIRNNLTLTCNYLEIESGGKLYGSSYLDHKNSNEIHSIRRPNILGDWNFVQVSEGIYRTRGSNSLIPVSSGGTGLENISKNSILYGKEHGALGILPIGASGRVLAVDGSGDLEWSASAGGGGDAFDSIAVSGQDSLAASAGDDLTLVAAGGMTITTNATSDTITFSSADNNDNTQNAYAISCVDGDNADEEKIRLTQSGAAGSATDDVVLEAGTGLSIARAGDKITFTNTVTDTNTQLDNAGVIGKVLTGLNVTGTTTDVAETDTIVEAIGHMEKRIRLNDDKVTNTDTNTQNTTTLSFVDSTNDIILRNTTGGAGSGDDDIKFVAGTGIVLTHTDADNITLSVGTLNQSTSGTAANATLSATSTIADDTGNASHGVVFVDSLTGAQALKSNSGITFNPSTNVLTTTTFSGALSGQAATATKLHATADINGVAFDGSGDITVTAAGSTLSDTVTVAKGGTNQTSYTNGQLLIGNTTGNTLAKATLTAGDNITITNGTGSITIAGTANDDVSIANLKTALAGGFADNAVSIGDADDVITIAGSLVVTGTTTTANVETVSTSGGIKFESNATGAHTDKETLLTGVIGLTSDITITLPSSTGTLALQNENTSGTAAGLSATLAIASGGTGATNSNGWLNSRITTNADGSLNYNATSATAVNHDNLAGFVTAEHYRWDNDISATAQINSANIPTLNQDTSGTAANVTTNADLTGDITSNGNATSIASGVIVNDDVKSDAAIAYSKLGTIPTWNQNTTGSAATLTTAREIGGVSFNGSADIDLPGVNAAGNQSTSGNAATATLASTITVADESSDTTCFPLFATAVSGSLAAKTGTNITFNSSDGTLTATNLTAGATVSGVTVSRGGAQLTRTTGQALGESVPSNFDCLRPNAYSTITNFREGFVGAWASNAWETICTINVGNNTGIETFTSMEAHLTVLTDHAGTTNHNGVGNYMATYKTMAQVKNGTALLSTNYAELGDTGVFPIQWAFVTISSTSYLCLQVQNKTGLEYSATDCNNDKVNIRTHLVAINGKAISV